MLELVHAATICGERAWHVKSAYRYHSIALRFYLPKASQSRSELTSPDTFLLLAYLLQASETSFIGRNQERAVSLHDNAGRLNLDQTSGELVRHCYCMMTCLSIKGIAGLFPMPYIIQSEAQQRRFFCHRAVIFSANFLKRGRMPLPLVFLSVL